MQVQSKIVGMVQCQTYDRQTVKEKLADLLQSISFSVSRGCKVLLKPNLIGAGNDGLACTHPQVVAAMAEWLLDHGARVSVGDSPAFGTARNVMRKCRIAEALQGLPVEMVNFTRPRKTMLACGVSLGIASEVLDCDLLINLPKLKAHSQLLLTGAVKNCFGAVVGLGKPILHAKYGDVDNRFEAALVDLLDVLPGGVSVLDGVVAMHRTGPMRGAACETAILAASENPVALDTAITLYIGKLAEAAPIWQECRRRQLAGADPAGLVFPRNKPGELPQVDFVLPELLKPVSFHPGRMLAGGLKRLIAQLR